MPDPVYSVEELVQGSVGFFGIGPPDVLGAFYGRSGSYTVAEAAAILTAWLGAPLPGPSTPSQGGGGTVVLVPGSVVRWDPVAGWPARPVTVGVVWWEALPGDAPSDPTVLMDVGDHYSGPPPTP